MSKATDYAIKLHNAINDLMPDVALLLAMGTADDCEVSVLKFSFGESENIVQLFDAHPAVIIGDLRAKMFSPPFEIKSAFTILMDNRLDAVYVLIAHSGLDMLNPTNDALFLIQSIGKALNRTQFN